MVPVPLWLLTTVTVGATISSVGGSSFAPSGEASTQNVCSRQSAVEALLFQAKAPEFIDVPTTAFSLEPYFAEGPRKQARLAFDRGQFAKVRETLTQAHDVSLPARFLAAQAAMSMRAYDVAASEFSALAFEYPPLSDDAWTNAGKAFLQLKQWAEAANAFLEVKETSTLWLEAQRGAAVALGQAKNFRSSLDVYQALLSKTGSLKRDERFSVLREALAIATKGNWKEELQNLQLEVWASYPQTSEARRVEAVLTSRRIPLMARVVRTETWVKSFRYEQARAEAKRILKLQPLPGEAACQAQWLIGKTFRIERRHEEAIVALKDVLTFCSQAELRAQALFVLGASQAMVNKEDSRKTYETLVEEYPDHALADDAMYLAADLALTAQEGENALGHLDDIVLRFPEGEFAFTAAFRRFWFFYGQQKWPEAQAAMDTLEDMVQAPTHAAFRPQTKYWKARLLQHQEKREDAQSLFSEVVELHPGTLYAAWAYKRLDKAERKGALTLGGDVERGLKELQADSRFARAVELARLGFPTAKGAFASVSLEGKSDEAAFAYLKVLGDLGYEKVYESMPERALLPVLMGPINSTTMNVFQAHRPRHFDSLLQGEAARWGVDVALLQGIVHRESGFNPRAQSPVGAIGLMQVMPDTARLLARKIALAPPSGNDLRQTQLNARLGAFFVSDLLRRFEGRAELAVAAYNAGPARVQRWWKDTASGEIDEFVESIPFKETRTYVKNVLGDREAYRLLRWKTAVSSAKTTRHGG